MAGLLGFLGLGNLLSTPPPTLSMAACSAIAASCPGITLTSSSGALNANYQYATDHYWSSVQADATPVCIVFPTSAEDVSAVIRVLLQYPSVPFAVKSGGHNANTGFSSVDGGILISFQNSHDTVLSPGRETARVDPGARWMDAVGALEPYGLTVVGGRLGDVGVGGLLLGCGLSFLSAQYGLPCDNVVNYEVVLSNSSIVNSNATSHPDLFWALKGGGNQFGIVTKYTLRTYPIGKVWGGVITYRVNYASQILSATQDFIENNQDPRAAMFATFELLLKGLDEFAAVFLFYNGESPPSGLFDGFLNIPNTSNQLQTQSYSALGTSIPSLAGTDGINLVNANYNNFVNYVSTQKSLISLLELDFIWTLIYQPMPTMITAASARINPAGNLLGLSPNSGDHMWMACTVAWEFPTSDSNARNYAIDIMNGISTYVHDTYPGVEANNYQAGHVDPKGYDFIFMNDAMADQRVLQGYGDSTYQRLKTIQGAYDRMGVFTQRTNGFKFT
ncbi:FAD-binding domain-containing protein [Stipitochalara longipes BDJ]|nr:FAD-binding domain-containing protein [Stipitochalara longipes BDJ]